MHPLRPVRAAAEAAEPEKGAWFLQQQRASGPLEGSETPCTAVQNLPGLEVDMVTYTTMADAFSKAYLSRCDVQLAESDTAGWQA